MIRRIITIDPDTCNGCGLCAAACHEGAIGMEGGKAVLLRDDYCDGLGDCLPACPTGAISFEEREALPYDEAAVQARMREKGLPGNVNGGPNSERKGCPGTAAKMLVPVKAEPKPAAPGSGRKSCLRQWPVQLKLTPVHAAYFEDANLLVAADCCAYAYSSFHREFMRGKVTVIGCPKLDGVDYTQKLAEILAQNTIRSVTVARMSVPCCGGLEQAVLRAVRASGKNLDCRVVTLSPEARIVSDCTHPARAEEAGV